MAKKALKIRKPRKKPERGAVASFRERLKKLSDNAPVVQLRGGRFTFDDEIIKFKDK